MSLEDYLKTAEQKEEAETPVKERKFKTPKAAKIQEVKKPQITIEEISDEEAAALIKNITNMILHLKKLRLVTDDDFVAIQGSCGNIVRTLIRYLGLDYRIYLDATMVSLTVWGLYKERSDEKKIGEAASVITEKPANDDDKKAS
jgi:hypothetical protein